VTDCSSIFSDRSDLYSVQINSVVLWPDLDGIVM